MRAAEAADASEETVGNAGMSPASEESKLNPLMCASRVTAIAATALLGACTTQHASAACCRTRSGAHGLELPGGQQSSPCAGDAHAQLGARPIMAIHSRSSGSTRRIIRKSVVRDLATIEFSVGRVGASCRVSRSFRIKLDKDNLHCQSILFTR